VRDSLAGSGRHLYHCIIVRLVTHGQSWAESLTLEGGKETGSYAKCSILFVWSRDFWSVIERFFSASCASSVRSSRCSRFGGEVWVWSKGLSGVIVSFSEVNRTAWCGLSCSFSLMLTVVRRGTCLRQLKLDPTRRHGRKADDAMKMDRWAHT
jgi:hypothetical protein